MNGTGLYHLLQQAYAHAVTRLVRRGFAGFGTKSVIQPPVRLADTAKVRIGSGTYIGPGCWIQGGSESLGWCSDEPTVLIGDRVSITGQTTISGARSVRIGDNVLIGRGVHISDHSHAYSEAKAVRDQGISAPRAVEIQDGAWLGQNVVISPGVTVGRFAVVGANSIVTHDVPARTVVAGAPARVIRELEG